MTRKNGSQAGGFLRATTIGHFVVPLLLGTLFAAVAMTPASAAGVRSESAGNFARSCAGTSFSSPLMVNEDTAVAGAATLDSCVVFVDPHVRLHLRSAHLTFTGSGFAFAVLGGAGSQLDVTGSTISARGVVYLSPGRLANGEGAPGARLSIVRSALRSSSDFVVVAASSYENGGDAEVKDSSLSGAEVSIVASCATIPGRCSNDSGINASHGTVGVKGSSITATCASCIPTSVISIMTNLSGVTEVRGNHFSVAPGQDAFIHAGRGGTCLARKNTGAASAEACS